MRVVVVGAGIAGLGSALVLARDGHDVVLIERDATPLPPDPEQAADWKRKGAPQVRHSHALLARMRNLLRDRLPDVREALLGAGATEVAWADMLPDTIDDRTPRPGDDDLVMLAGRRTTFEWVLRTAAQDEIELRDGVTVTGLRLNGRVGGVDTDRGPVDADLVVEATGRPSRALGATVAETSSDAGIVYLSRFYRLRDGVDPPTPMAFTGVDLEYLKVGVIQGDNRTVQITLAYNTHDEAMKVLRGPGRFDRAAGLVEPARVWTDPDVCIPITDVHFMGGLINRVRHQVVDGEPVVRGVYLVGDSAVCTNPLYGRGCSLALVHGVLLADAVAEHGDDHRRLAIAFDDATTRELLPWYEAARQQDAVNTKLARGEALSDAERYIRSVVREGLLPAMRRSAAASRAWFRSFNLLSTPDATFQDAEAMTAIFEAWQQRETREPDPPLGPTRRAFLEELCEQR